MGYSRDLSKFDVKVVLICQEWEIFGFRENSSFLGVPGTFVVIRLNLMRKSHMCMTVHIVSATNNQMHLFIGRWYIHAIMGCRPVSSRLITFVWRHHHHPSLCPNNWLRWWWHWRLLWSNARSHRPGAKERHPCSSGWLECKDRRGCKKELEGDMQPILQPWDQRKRLEAPRIRQLQQPEGGKHIWSTQTIWTLDMAQPRRRLPQSDWLHHGQTTLSVKWEHCKDQELILKVTVSL